MPPAGTSTEQLWFLNTLHTFAYATTKARMGSR